MGVSVFRYFDVIQNGEYPPVGFIHYECAFEETGNITLELSDEEIGHDPDCLVCGRPIVNEEFDAILAKNGLARQLALAVREPHSLPIEWMIYRLEEIEKVTGVGNQPTVRDIYSHNSNPDRNFNI